MRHRRFIRTAQQYQVSQEGFIINNSDAYLTPYLTTPLKTNTADHMYRRTSHLILSRLTITFSPYDYFLAYRLLSRLSIYRSRL